MDMSNNSIKKKITLKVGQMLKLTLALMHGLNQVADLHRLHIFAVKKYITRLKTEKGRRGGLGREE